MKKNIKAFLTGALAMALVLGLTISALAISGRMTIEIDPINIQVNGETFQPKDVNGNEVPVFAYNGTTYAPLRALAEAYGLEVGYDAKRNMATVSEPSSAPVVTDADPKNLGKWIRCNALQIGDKVYELPEYCGLDGVQVDENQQIYVRDGVTMDVLQETIYLIEGEYEIVDGTNPLADGRIKYTAKWMGDGTISLSSGKTIETSNETVYISASEQGEDYRFTYNGKTYVSPESPYFDSKTDNIGIRKIHAYGSVTPIGWWYNLNDLVSYFGLNGTLSVIPEKNLLVFQK